MTDTFFDAYDAVSGELMYLSSLLTAALCVREHQADVPVISDLLYLAVEKVKEATHLVETMHLKHRKAVDTPQPDTDS